LGADASDVREVPDVLDGELDGLVVDEDQPLPLLRHAVELLCHEHDERREARAWDTTGQGRSLSGATEQEPTEAREEVDHRIAGVADP
jgi:hypothetical protein